MAYKMKTENTPVLGGPATFTLWTDSFACEVVAISPSGKRATLRAMKARLLNGVDSGEPDALQFSPGGFVGHTSGTQRYALESDPNGRTWEVSARKRGEKTVWKEVGAPTRSPGACAIFGVALRHRDYNF